MKKNITACCVCNVGLKRKNNEDNFYFNKETLPEVNLGLEEPLVMTKKSTYKGFVLGVFDGMGGENNGEVASYLSAKTLVDKKISRGQPATDFLENLVSQMNDKVCESLEELRCGRMGSTAVMCLLKRNHLTMCNVGDSRGFRYRDDYLFQMTMDHNESALFSNNSDTKSALTQHIGIDPEEFELVPHIISSELKSGDLYLICSDGLTDMVTVREMKRILRDHKDVKETTQKLLDKALENGGKDNVTIILISVE